MKTTITPKEATGLKIAVLSTIIFIFLVAMCSAMNINNFLETIIDTSNVSVVTYALAILTYASAVMIIEGITMVATINGRFRKASGFAYVIIILIAALLTAGIIIPHIPGIDFEDFSSAFTTATSLSVTVIYVFGFLTVRNIVLGCVELLEANAETDWAIRVRKTWKRILVAMIVTFVLTLIFVIGFFPAIIVAAVPVLTGEGLGLTAGIIIGMVVIIIALIVFEIILLVNEIKIMVHVWRISNRMEALN